MRSLPFLLAPLVGACVATVGSSTDTSFMSTNPPPRPMRARAFDTVEIYTSSTPPRPFTEVGLIRVIAHGHGAMQDAVIALRTKAASVGCDGVVVTGTTSSTGGSMAYNGACFLYAEDTTWAPPVGPGGAPSCDSMLAEVRAAPNDAKPHLAQRVPPECFATSPGS